MQLHHRAAEEMDRELERLRDQLMTVEGTVVEQRQELEMLGSMEQYV